MTGAMNGGGALVGLVLASALGGCDPVHSDAKAALGDETPGVRTGPLHRPGQPCGTCHTGGLGNPREFSVAGTIFLNAADRVPAVGVAVTLTSANGASYTAKTNAAGNFYIEPSQFTPAYPMNALVTSSAVIVRMSTLIGREGSCSVCHSDPPGPSSAGHIYIPAPGATTP